MRKIYSYLQNFITKEVKWSYAIVIVIFLAISIFAEYHFHLTAHYIKPLRYTTSHLFVNIIFYSIPLLFALFAYMAVYNRWQLAANYSFLATVAFIIIAFSIRIYMYQYSIFAKWLVNGEADAYLIRCLGQASKALFVMVVVILYWVISGDSKRTRFYGFRLRQIDLKPYFILLLLMMPLIAAASLQHDFLRRYPTFASILPIGITNLSDLLRLIVYELLYGTDYVAIELFFRGLVLFSLSRFLGRGAIIPMATMYVFIHFGKPLGETISSFFGGIILGVIAYETKSIIGGIIIHVGIAWLMELGGFLGNSL